MFSFFSKVFFVVIMLTSVCGFPQTTNIEVQTKKIPQAPRGKVELQDRPSPSPAALIIEKARTALRQNLNDQDGSSVRLNIVNNSFPAFTIEGIVFDRFHGGDNDGVWCRRCHNSVRASNQYYDFENNNTKNFDFSQFSVQWRMCADMQLKALEHSLAELKISNFDNFSIVDILGKLGL